MHLKIIIGGFREMHAGYVAPFLLWIQFIHLLGKFSREMGCAHPPLGFVSPPVQENPGSGIEFFVSVKSLFSMSL